MKFDFRTLPPREQYHLLAGTILPRPIALITTADSAGRVNAAPFSFFNVLSFDPGIVAIGIEQKAPGTPKDTVANARAQGEFVVNLVDQALAERMNICAIDFPEGVDELAEAGLTAIAAERVIPPRIGEAPAAFECKLVQELNFGVGGRRSVLIGEVLMAHVRDELLDGKGRLATERVDQVGRIGGSVYVRLSDRFEMPRIELAAWRARGGS